MAVRYIDELMTLVGSISLALRTFCFLLVYGEYCLIEWFSRWLVDWFIDNSFIVGSISLELRTLCSFWFTENLSTISDPTGWSGTFNSNKSIISKSMFPFLYIFGDFSSFPFTTVFLRAIVYVIIIVQGCVRYDVGNLSLRCRETRQGWKIFLYCFTFGS